MTKENFLKNFPQEDEFLVASLFEDIELSRNIDYVVYSNHFLPPNIWKTLEKLQNLLKIGVKSLGLNHFSERKVVAFYPLGDENHQFDFPINYFKIHGENKFRDLKHKDFLGTLMSLGIKREVMGDLVVKDNICYGTILKDFFQMIQKDITSVASIPVKISIADEFEIPQPNFLEMNGTVSSLRLDSLVAEALNCSRGNAESLIESGNVLVDYQMEKKTSKTISPNSIITVKKNGKFLFYKELGENKKGKIKILLKKYI